MDIEYYSYCAGVVYFKNIEIKFLFNSGQSYYFRIIIQSIF